jgi:hypothetical protein
MMWSGRAMPGEGGRAGGKQAERPVRALALPHRPGRPTAASGGAP